MVVQELDRVIQRIIEGCSYRGITVTEALATFMARVVIENDPVQFAPDAELRRSDVECLISLCVDRLCENDSPAMETIKMQVGFDSTYVSFEQELKVNRRARDYEKQECIRGILSIRPKSSSDYETLSTLYHQIYDYLVQMSRDGPQLARTRRLSYGNGKDEARETPIDNSASEREIAAAMESVFPRVGLKSFVQLSAEDKRAQLEELARIVTGIRLFNRECGKGGAGLNKVESIVATKVSDLREILESENAEQQDLAMRYQETLVYCHLRKPEGVTEAETTRWGQELTNRRQYCAYLASLAEDAAASAQRVAACRDKFDNDLTELKSLVGGRASVPKDLVYPKFDAIASTWFDLDDELRVVEARAEALEELHRFRESYRPTLPRTHPVYRAAKLESRAKLGCAERDSKSIVEDEADMADAIVAGHESQQLPQPVSPSDSHDATLDGLPTSSSDPEGPVWLSVETTPEFMQLPLEYQGFCGWTVANRHGLLLPGKPSLGVVKYKGACYVFAHAVALKAFLEHPEAVKEAVLDTAAKNPELVHLLRLQDQYSGTSIARIIAAHARQRARRNSFQNFLDVDDTAAGLLAPAARYDASTETPTHFVEEHVDRNYEWNEWELRRRALRFAHLKNYCQTHSMQTDKSHFRRDNHSQVYLPRIAATQTRRNNGSNPPIKLQYVAGLRGKQRPTKYCKDPPSKVGIVTLTYELA